MKIHCALLLYLTSWLLGQENLPVELPEPEELKHRIVIEPPERPKEPEMIYQASVVADAKILRDQLVETAVLDLKVSQKGTGTLSVEVTGPAMIATVTGEKVKGWSVRREGPRRFLEIERSTPEVLELKATVVLKRDAIKVPGEFGLTGYGPGSAMSFSATYEVSSDKTVKHLITQAKGLVALKGREGVDLFLAKGAASLKVAAELSAAAPAPVELREMKLTGEVLSPEGSATFQLSGVAYVTTDEPVSVTVLGGKAAPMKAMANENYRLSLTSKGYQLVFEKSGVFPIQLSFVTPVQTAGEWKKIDFFVPSAAVVPIELKGIPATALFDGSSPVNPVLREDKHEAFLPANGICRFAWQPERKTSDGKLFFTSEAMEEISVGAGLLRQMISLTVRTLQGELPSLDLQLAGQGEVLAVEGENVLSWQVTDTKVLEIRLSRPVTKEASFIIRSQSALNALPVRSEPLRMTPTGAVRHSGYFRVYNRGAVRIEVMKQAGLTQLSPDQYPEAAALPKSVRQVFHYRFPAANRSFMVSAERVKPEINASQILSYELTETDRVLRADLELEIREAGIREWEFFGPADYSVVSLTGAEVSDYVVGAPENGRRRLKVIFAKEVSGRRLVKVHFEKNQPAGEGVWALPVLDFPGSTMVRGELGVSATPGYRVNPGKVTEQLSEIPLTRLLKRGPNLQQAFRIRAANWSAEMEIKALSQNVQADTYHFYSLQEGTAYVSVLLNYFVTGAPINEWRLTLPEGLQNLSVDGRDMRDYRQVEGELVVPLHGPVMGAYQLLVTFEQKAEKGLALGGVSANGVQSERGFIQVVSPGQVELASINGGESLLVLDPLELPAEYQLMSTAPTLKAWQYQRRPFELSTEVSWFQRGETAKQVVEFASITSQLARDGGVVTVSGFDVRTRDGQEVKLSVPEGVTVRDVLVNEKPVTLRKAGDLFLIPLPEDVSPIEPVRLQVISSFTSPSGEKISLVTPMVHDTTQLATKWTVKPDTGYRLKPEGGNGVSLLTAFSMENGLDWIEREALASFVILVVVWIFGTFLMRAQAWISILGAALVLFSAAGSFYLSSEGMTQSIEVPKVLEYGAPVIAPEANLGVTVIQEEAGAAQVSTVGVVMGILGIAAVAGVFFQPKKRALLWLGAGFTISVAVLLHVGGAGWFFLGLGIVILARWWLGAMRCLDQWKKFFDRPEKPEEDEEGDDENGNSDKDSDPDPVPGAKGAVTALLAIGLVLGLSGGRLEAKTPAPVMKSAESLVETWKIKGRRLHSEGTLTASAKAGDRLLLVGGPAILTKFAGPGVKVVTEGGAYVLIPLKDGRFEASFSYQAPAGSVTRGIPILTGQAAVRTLTVDYEASGWSIESDAAVRKEVLQGKGSKARLWLAPMEKAMVVLSPKARDVAAEETRFYAEVDDLFVPGPGVVDGRHRVRIRPAQGQVKQLVLSVPKGFTVSEVRSKLAGPWRFDPQKYLLTVELTPFQSKPFYLDIETQCALAELPTEVSVSPMRVTGVAGEVGMLALAFGKEAQLDQDKAEGMSPVNLADFSNGMIPRDRESRPTASLQKVYRYSKAKASLSVKVSPVAPEVRVETKQRLSFGEERTVLAVDLTATITRAGVFRLSFPLPAGFEVESLSSPALNHWAEVKEDNGQVVMMNLNGKTIGTQKFALVLTSATPTLPVESWAVPKVTLREANRQSGQFVIVPGRGIQLSVLERKDLSALDPRAVGGVQAGSLAFRLLQKSWSLALGVDQLASSVAALVLHDVELREGRSKARVDLRLQVDHASIREIEVTLPLLSEVDAQTVRVSGAEVRDIINIEGNRWRVRFKRRVVGEVPLRIEFEKTEPSKTVEVVTVDTARQQSSYLALRPGARLRLKPVKASGWDLVDWSVLPKALYQLDRTGAPAAFLRSNQNSSEVEVSLSRHSVVAGARIRVLRGSLTTVVSAGGEAMNQATLELEALQRGSLTLTLPEESRLFGVFVNEENVLVVQDGDSYRFQVMGDLAAGQRNRAVVRFTYSQAVGSGRLKKLQLEAFKIGEPLENVSWQVTLPKGYEMAGSSGDFDFVKEEELKEIARDEYRAMAQRRKAEQDDIATMRLNNASGLLKAGDNINGNIALEQVFNQGNLDKASNEDVRVQMERVSKRNAVIALNTRRQRLYNDNSGAALEVVQGQAEQIQTAMKSNPVFNGQLNVGRDDYSNIISGNDAEVNRMLDTIAGKWVRNQRITQPTGKMIDPVVPPQGTSLTFARLIQVDGGDSLKLQLELKTGEEPSSKGRKVVVLVLIVLCAVMGARLKCRKFKA
ncbi:MAG: hypothetical protein ACPGJR_05465 [Akkermansiaceae bacterium]